MGLVTKQYTFSVGATIQAAEHNANFDTLYTEINGNIDNANIKAGAGIVDTKLAQITTANKVAQSSVVEWPFKSGDWIISSVTTARTGWTNVSATYSNKFMRINATPLTTSGSDTHSHTLSDENIPAHTHTIPNGSGGAGGNYIEKTQISSSGTITTSSFGSGTAFTGDNVPAYVQVAVFQMN